MERHFKLDVWIEHRVDEGEDARPVARVEDHRGLLAVFDGMGGAGGTRYDYRGTRRSGAWIAAGLAREVVDSAIGDLIPSGADSFSRAAEVGEDLRARLQTRFLEMARLLDTGNSRLGGNLIRRLPTTLTCLAYCLTASNTLRFVVWSAGDSRAYLLLPKEGLQQLSTDDLKSSGDALANICEESPLSNYVNADTAFRINAVTGECEFPATLLVATDGCFGYYESPAHFEHVLLQTLGDASEPAGWETALSQQLKRVAGDDASLALAAVGWSQFEEMRASYEERRRYVNDTFVEPLRELDQGRREVMAAADGQLPKRDAELRRLWQAYRDNYEWFAKRADVGES